VTALVSQLSAVISTTAFRLAAASAAGFLIVAALVVGVLFWQTNDLMTEHVIRSLKAEAAELARDGAAGDLEALTAKVRARSRPEGPELYFLGGAQGVKLAGNLNRIPPELAAHPKGGVFRYEGTDSGQVIARLGVAVPVDVGGDARLVIGRDIEEQRAFAGRIKQGFLLGFGLLSLVAVLAGLAVSKSVLGRIEEMSGASRSIMAGNLAQRIPLRGSADELDGLAHSLNVMLDRIEQLMGGLREVSDNIAHDLKTPLTRLRNRAEAALRDPRGADAYREGLERTIEEADELIKTFNALLLIARLEAGAVEENTERFDLGELVRDVSELYEPVAEEAGLGLKSSVPDRIFVRGNRQLIGQAVANLADNAIKYSSRDPAVAAGEEIEVDVVPHLMTVEVKVADRGPGIAEKDRTRALRRFVRLDESRTKPGTGLGLSLVAAVARLHGGRVRLEDNAPGLKVVLELPRAADASAGVAHVSSAT
jgi:signal transduction histidine kinase